MINWTIVRFGEDSDRYYATNWNQSTGVYNSKHDAYLAGVKIFSKFGYIN